MRGSVHAVALVVVALALLSCAEAGPQRSRQSSRITSSRHRSRITSSRSGRRSRVAVPEEGEGPQLELSRAWRVLSYDFTGAPVSEEELRSSGRYVPANVLPTDVVYDTDGRPRLFVATPALRPGTPATLSVVSLADNETAPALRPYPSWSSHATTADSVTDCANQIVSVSRTTKSWTSPDLLYAVDSGLVNLAGNPQRLCPPKIVTFDLVSDTIANTTQIRAYAPNSLYHAIQVDEVAATQPVAYTVDLTNFRLATTNLATGETHRLQSQYFYPSPGFGITDIAGQHYYLMYGVSALALDARRNGTLYTSAFASNLLGAISTSTILAAQDQDVLDFTTKVVLPGHRAGPTGAIAVDPAGQRLFFGIAEREALYCWDTSKPYEQSDFRLLARDTEALQFFNGVVVQQDGSRLWVLTNRFTKYLAGNIDNADVNYRVFHMDIDDLTC